MSDKDIRYQVLTHDRLAERFEQVTSAYDLQRRLDVLITEFLAGVPLKGKLVLDAGCGTGRSAQRFREQGAQVVALDLAPGMVAITRSRCACWPLIASVAELPFPSDTFDVVFSTEVIEHAPDPLACACELYRALKPGGHLVLSTPNRLWQWPVRLASALHLRPFDGLENFQRPPELRAALEKTGALVLEHRGIHLLPFQIKPLHPLLHYLDRYGATLLPLMINQAIHCIKPT